MNQLKKVLTDGQVSRLKRWCLFKQEDGFQGRPNKDCDSCYSFWVGATLKLLNSYDFVNFKLNKQFILSTQEHVIGGLAKYPGVSSGIQFRFSLINWKKEIFFSIKQKWKQKIFIF